MTIYESTGKIYKCAKPWLIEVDRVPENPKTRPENQLPDPTQDQLLKTRLDPKPEKSNPTRPETRKKSRVLVFKIFSKIFWSFFYNLRENFRLR